MDQHMNDGLSGAAGAALIKAYGLKALIGMAGTTLLFLALPPVDKDGRLNKREFFFRLLCAGVASTFCGDWAVQVLTDQFPSLHATDHRAAIYLLVGSPAWMVTRAGALWAQKRKDKDLGELVDDVKEKV
jgi:hypothetical protein